MELGIPAGRACLTAAGLPTDGGDTLRPEDGDRPAVLAGSTQHLIYSNQAVRNPYQRHRFYTSDWMEIPSSYGEPRKPEGHGPGGRSPDHQRPGSPDGQA
jgi:hypothetical protein